MMTEVSAFPDLDKGDGKPCSIINASRMEQAYERIGQGYRQNPSRALSSRSDGGVPDGGFEAVEEDLIKLMAGDAVSFTDPFLVSSMATPIEDWPADVFSDGAKSYAGLMIRLAWHCSGE